MGPKYARSVNCYFQIQLNNIQTFELTSKRNLSYSCQNRHISPPKNNLNDFKLCGMRTTEFDYRNCIIEYLYITVLNLFDFNCKTMNNKFVPVITGVSFIYSLNKKGVNFRKE